MKLDLGCGKRKRAGWVGVDIASSSQADLLADLRNGIPLRSDCAEQILADNVLEHMPDLVGIMNEIWRVAKHGAELAIIVPYYTSMGAFQDPTHVRFFTEKTFLYFDRSLPYDYGFRGRFEIKSVELVPNPDFSKDVPGIPMHLAAKYFFNAIQNMKANLVADKMFRPDRPVERRTRT